MQLIDRNGSPILGEPLDLPLERGQRVGIDELAQLLGPQELAEQILVEHGTRPADELYLELRTQSRNDGVTDIDTLLAGGPQPWSATAASDFELHRIGDAVASRNIATAILDAIRLCSAF